MTTTIGLRRMYDEEFEQEELNTLTTATAATATPRPNSMSMEDDTAERQEDAATKAMLSFSQAAKHAAVALKRRRSPKSRTFYCMGASRQVKHAFDDLEKRNEMKATDFQLLKEAISNFRVRLIVHDSKTFEELQQMRQQVQEEEKDAEHATYKAFMEVNHENRDIYLNTKDKYHDLKTWNAELSKEINRIEPKYNYGFMLMQQQSDAPKVASQHAQIAHTSGITLRNILRPETIRRTFISLNSLTHKIREEVSEFLKDTQRFKDRKEVVKQIKEDLAAAAARKRKEY